MSKLEDIDPIFAKDGKGSEAPAYRLEDIDPIFKIEDKKQAATPVSEKDFMSWLVNKIEPKTAESAAGAVAGAYLNPKIQNTAKYVAEGKAATAAKAAQEAAAAAAQKGVGLPPAGGPHVPTPAGGKGTLNYGKAVLGLSDVDAARAANYGDSWKVAQQVAEAEKKIGPNWKMQPNRANILLNESVGSGPRGVPRAAIPPVQAPAAPSIGALQRTKNVLGTAGEMMGKIPKLSGALAGAGAVEGFQEASNRWQQGDVPGAMIAGAGGVGSLASMIPHPLTRAVGAGVGMASPAALMVLDKLRQQSGGQQQLAGQP